MRPRGESDISPLACPDFHGNIISELRHTRDEQEREALTQQRERLQELRDMTHDEQTRLELEKKIAAIEAALNI